MKCLGLLEESSYVVCPDKRRVVGSGKVIRGMECRYFRVDVLSDVGMCIEGWDGD